ncbi:MAG: DUF4465 domain-containing protein [Bacteroidia bacterium]|nr:DUF4465 domain-containing protein [Bacteroidia bacterium]
MKKIVLSIATLLAVNVMVKAQGSIVDFENLVTDSTGYENGANLGGAPFKSKGLVFENYYSSQFGPYWEGWAYSNNTDTVNTSYANQYSTFAPMGGNNMAKFALIYKDTKVVFDSINNNGTNLFLSLQISNSTLAVRDMQNGSGFSKKFGGATGNDPDYFYVKFTSVDTANTNSVVFYLADFRDSNNVNDYIVKTWKLVDLTPLNATTGIKMSFASSDVGSFGINTPTYACIDNIIHDKTVGVNTKVSANTTQFYPNPASAFITTNATTTSIYNVAGALLITSTDAAIAINDLATGYYVVKMTGANGTITSQKLIKQ